MANNVQIDHKKKAFDRDLADTNLSTQTKLRLTYDVYYITFFFLLFQIFLRWISSFKISLENMLVYLHGPCIARSVSLTRSSRSRFDWLKWFSFSSS